MHLQCREEAQLCAIFKDLLAYWEPGEQCLDLNRFHK